MGILTRFTDIMKSNINALLDKCEDPAKMIDQTLRDLREDLAEVKKEFTVKPSPVWKIMNFLRLLIRTLLRLFYLSLHRCMMMDWEIRRRLIVKYIIW